ncbi:MAG: 50S ribosomal protein L18 [Candidatus Roizmanbacteria bacterium]
MKDVNISRTNRRKSRVSRKMFGTTDRPRVNIFRSSKYIYAQVIDDTLRKTLMSSSSLNIENKEDKKTKSIIAKEVGIHLAKKLLGVNIKQVVFDRSMYSYNGRVKQLAEGLREGGIQV